MFLYSGPNHLNQLKKKETPLPVTLPWVVAGSLAPCRAQWGAGQTLARFDSSRAPYPLRAQRPVVLLCLVLF